MGFLRNFQLYDRNVYPIFLPTYRGKKKHKTVPTVKLEDLPHCEDNFVLSSSKLFLSFLTPTFAT